MSIFKNKSLPIELWSLLITWGRSFANTDDNINTHDSYHYNMKQMKYKYKHLSISDLYTRYV